MSNKKRNLEFWAIIISIFSLLVSGFSIYTSSKIANKDISLDQRPYLFTANYNYVGMEGNYDLPSYIRIVVSHNPALILNEEVIIKDADDKLFDVIRAKGKRIIYSAENSEFIISSSKFASLIRSEKAIVNNKLLAADNLQKANNYTRFISIQYKSLNQETKYTFKSTEIFKNGIWQILDIDSKSEEN